MSTTALALQHLPQAAPARVLACGAWLKNTACLLDGQRAWTSPVHGDLGTHAARMQLQDSLARLQAQASGPIAAVAHDVHPDFFSTELAQQWAHQLGVPAIAVQHHHAHLAQVQAQHAPEGALLGWALDGIGMGCDGSAWGGELLLAQGSRCVRLAHLPTLAMPGGDAAAQEPWRMAAALLHQLQWPAEEVLADSTVAHLRAGSVRAVDAASRQGVTALLQRGLRCPPTSSGGRWFDAVAGVLGVCWWQTQEAQAAVALEQLAAQWLQTHAAPVVPPDVAAAGLDLEPLMRHLLALRCAAEESAGDVARFLAMQQHAAALFHVALADALAGAAQAAAQAHGLRAVALSGGCFFNSVLRGRVEAQLRDGGCTPLSPKDGNCGDAGLSLGQAWVAAHAVAEPARTPASDSTKRNPLCV